MSNSIKQFRGQIRQIVKEILPEVLTQELVSIMKKEMLQDIKACLDVIDERQKLFQGYMVRQSAPVMPLPPKKED